jgi:hypothetical protein
MTPLASIVRYQEPTLPICEIRHAKSTYEIKVQAVSSDPHFAAAIAKRFSSASGPWKRSLDQLDLKREAR